MGEGKNEGVGVVNIDVGVMMLGIGDGGVVGGFGGEVVVVLEDCG